MMAWLVNQIHQNINLKCECPVETFPHFGFALHGEKE
jgi:hypothetical protein